MPYRFKLAFNDRIGILVAGETVIVEDRETGPTQAGFGDLSGILKLVHPVKTPLPAGEEKDQVGWVATASYAVTDRLSLAGEFFGSHRESVRPFLQYLTAANDFITPRLMGDAGVAFGLTGASQEWTAFAGVTLLAWKLI